MLLKHSQVWSTYTILHFGKLCIVVSVQSLPFCYFQQADNSLKKKTSTPFSVTVKHVFIYFLSFLGQSIYTCITLLTCFPSRGMFLRWTHFDRSHGFTGHLVSKSFVNACVQRACMGILVKHCYFYRESNCFLLHLPSSSKSICEKCPSSHYGLTLHN